MATAGLVVFLLLLLRHAATSAGREDSIIHVPSNLLPGLSSWLSSSGQFAFGFYDTPNGYAVCIFLAAASERTVVWMANNFDPILPDYVFNLSIAADGVDLWQNRGGIINVYNHIARPKQPIESASMLDNGNFVLYSSVGGVIWQSFDYPSHALLPGQRLPPGGELFSRASQTDLDIGLFRLMMQTDGDLVQYPVSTPDTDQNAYFTFTTPGSVGNLSLNLDIDGRLYLLDHNSTSFDIANGSGGAGTIYLATVDPDGIFRLYNRSLDDHEANWMIVWSSTEDKCVPKGICGVNSICSSQDQVVTCTCLPGYRASSAGCNQGGYNVRDCRIKNTSVKYDITVVENVIWDYNYYDVDVADREEDCYHACVDDCECVVAVFGSSLCYKQRTPLRYGRLWTTDSSTAALVKVTIQAPAPAEAPAPAPNASGFRKGIAGPRKGIQLKYVLIGVTIGIAVLLLLSIIICYLSKQTGFWGQDEESNQNVDKLVLCHGSLAPKRYSYKQIRKFTKSFAEKLGQGGYGIVYKGQLPDGQLVAVKVLTKTHDNAEEFVNEVASISRTSHVNIVNLLGFCYGRKKRALVYEFMPNTSLDKFISSDAECSLEWSKLYEIAVGVARGLEYLHRGCNTRIVHFDIKPQNILLDKDLCPKISDFGLAKLCMKRQSVISMLGTRGTLGYIAPEVFSRNFGLVSHKSDVYSYGIMLLQMAEARANVEVKSVEWSESYFLERVYKQVLVRNEKVYGVMREEEEEGVRKMLMVGFWCIQTTPADRPSMNNVVDMLQGNVQCIQIPPLPFLLSSPKPQLSCLFPGFIETQKVLLEASDFVYS